jgi:hypothetical protein
VRGAAELLAGAAVPDDPLLPHAASPAASTITLPA